jgi:hypothetical protein
LVNYKGNFVESFARMKAEAGKTIVDAKAEAKGREEKRSP